MASSSTIPTTTADATAKSSTTTPKARIPLTEQHVAQLYAEVDMVRRRRSSFASRRLSDANTVPTIRPSMLISPSKKIVFNAPFADSDAGKVWIKNIGDRRVGWAIKVNNIKHITVYPASGVLDPEAGLFVTLYREPIRKKALPDDVLTLTWVASGSPGQPSQFGLSSMIKLAIEYND